MGWFSDRIDALKNNVGKAWDSATETVSGAWNSTTKAVSDAANWVGDTASDAWAVVEVVIDDPSILKEGIQEGLHNVFVDAPKAAWGGITTAAEATGNFAVYAWNNPGRAFELSVQGVVNAGASTVGMVGDLGVLAYNGVCELGVQTYNLGRAQVVAIGNAGLRARNMFYEGEEQIDLIDHKMVDYKWAKADCTGYLTDKVTFARPPENNYERILMYGPQVVVEVGAFVAVSVATAGAGGAALAAARGGTYAARGANIASKSARIMGMARNTGGVFNKVAAPIHQATGKVFSVAARGVEGSGIGGRALQGGMKASQIMSPVESGLALGIEGVAGTGAFTIMSVMDAAKQKGANQMLAGATSAHFQAQNEAAQSTIAQLDAEYETMRQQMRDIYGYDLDAVVAVQSLNIDTAAVIAEANGGALPANSVIARIGPASVSETVIEPVGVAVAGDFDNSRNPYKPDFSSPAGQLTATFDHNVQQGPYSMVVAASVNEYHIDAA